MRLLQATFIKDLRVVAQIEIRLKYNWALTRPAKPYQELLSELSGLFKADEVLFTWREPSGGEVL